MRSYKHECSHKESFLVALHVIQHEYVTRPNWLPSWPALKPDSDQIREMPQMMHNWYEQQHLLVNSPKENEFCPLDVVVWATGVERSFPAHLREPGIDVAVLRKQVLESIQKKAAGAIGSKRKAKSEKAHPADAEGAAVDAPIKKAAASAKRPKIASAPAPSAKMKGKLAAKQRAPTAKSGVRPVRSTMLPPRLR